MLEFVREASASQLELFRFNDMTDFDINCSPGDIWEDLRTFNDEYFDSFKQDFVQCRLNFEQNLDKKYFKISSDDLDKPLEVKIKFFAANTEEDNCGECEPARYRVRFVKKKGNLQEWYDIFKTMRETLFDEVLLLPKVHEAEELTAASDEEVSV
jgi:hypothetical protein